MIDFSDVDKNRAKVFLKYIIHSANKHRKLSNRPEFIQKVVRSSEIIVPKDQRVDDRFVNLSESRKDELELKISMHYTKNKYLPYELKLNKLKSQYSTMKRSKKHSKTKLEVLKKKISNVNTLLKDLKKADNDRFKGHRF
jgi:chromosome segregation ATPase